MRHLVVVIAVAFPAVAAAQGSDASPAGAGGEEDPLSSEDVEARALFEAGQTAYDAGRYEAALAYFEQAYVLAEHPVLLFNIGSAAERLRRDQKALDAYRAYLEALPDAANRRAVLARIDILTRQTSGNPTTTESTTPAAESTAATPPDARSAPTATPWGVGLMVGAGITLALTVGAFVWWLDRTDAVDMCGPPDRFCENRDTLDSEQSAALVAWIGGALVTVGASVTGLVLLSQSDSTEAASISCGPGVLSLHCRGRF